MIRVHVAEHVAKTIQLPNLATFMSKVSLVVQSSVPVHAVVDPAQ